jgi:hypothetical protein
MSIDPKELRSLPIAEKLRLVELLWDDIGASDEPSSCIHGKPPKWPEGRLN